MIIVLMGVSGAGKTTVGRLLTSALGWRFFEADDYHSPDIRERLARGERLSDADRAPWLDRLAGMIRSEVAAGRSLVLACSALKASYRSRLRSAAGTAPIHFVFLKVDARTAAERARKRVGHFTTEELVPHQFADLEEPGNALVVDATRTPDELVNEIRARLADLRPSTFDPDYD